MIIRNAQLNDAPMMVTLSQAKRANYEKAQPMFWKMAQGADAVQQAYFQELIHKDSIICLVATNQDQLQGFLIG